MRGARCAVQASVGVMLVAALGCGSRPPAPSGRPERLAATAPEPPTPLGPGDALAAERDAALAAAEAAERFEAFLGAWADADCEASRRCGVEYGDAASCGVAMRGMADIAFGGPLAAVAAGTAVFDDAAADACVAALAAAPCETRGGSFACAGHAVHRGTIGVGGACARTPDCLPELHCDDGPACGDVGRCVARIPEGSPCEPGDVCVGRLGCVSGLCAPYPRAFGGAACDGRLPFACGTGLACVEGRCVPRTSRGVDGAGCDVRGPRGCVDGLVCARGPGAADSTCMPGRLPVGAECRSASPQMCAYDASCDLALGRCVARPRAGEACDVLHPCDVRSACDCVVARPGCGTCVERRRSGEPCASDLECWSAFCAEGHCLGAGLCD